MSPSRRSVRGLARLQRSHSCTGRPAVRQSAPLLNSFAVIAKSGAVIAKSGAVIASAAKQSMAAAKDGLLRRFAPRNDATLIQTRFRVLATRSARGVDESSAH